MYVRIEVTAFVHTHYVCTLCRPLMGVDLPKRNWSLGKPVGCCVVLVSMQTHTYIIRLLRLRPMRHFHETDRRGSCYRISRNTQANGQEMKHGRQMCLENVYTVLTRNAQTHTLHVRTCIHTYMYVHTHIKQHLPVETGAFIEVMSDVIWYKCANKWGFFFAVEIQFT